jgi:CBS domain-containing protein
MNVPTIDDQTGGRREIERLRVADAMHAGVISCHREAPLSAVARLMADERVHCVVVRGDEDAGDAPPWGVVSDLDLVAAATARALDEQTAGGSAATPVVSVAPEETLERAAQLMTEHASAHLLVVDQTTMRPVGVISTLDVARALMGG